jgi:hypothetical protein
MKFDIEKKCELALDLLEYRMGAADAKWDCITCDIPCEEDCASDIVFKTMSNNGEMDDTFANNIEKIFEQKNIEYKHGLQHRVFIVKLSEFFKLLD